MTNYTPSKPHPNPERIPKASRTSYMTKPSSCKCNRTLETVIVSSDGEHRLEGSISKEFPQTT